MNADHPRHRTKRFAIAIIKYAKTLRSDTVSVVIARQLVKSVSNLQSAIRNRHRFPILTAST